MDFVPDLMVRIVQNLLSNAFKFSEKGAAVTVSLYRSIEKSGGCIHVSVRDQGVGMTPEQSSAVFEPFYQVEGGFRDMGTGIGLSLVKLAAETMGGNVTVGSTIGKGTEFIVDIPVRHDLAISPIDECMVPEGNNILDPVSSSVTDDPATDSDVPRILIVEDMPEVARWEMRQLGPDYAFYFAPDGAEGLRKAEDIVPDLIITDVMMPVMDGLEMCRRIRNSELLCHIPVIMVTARATHEDRLKGLEAGADAYMEKPYDESELDLRVRKLLQQRSMLKKMFSERFDSHVCDNSDEPAFSVADRLFLDRFDATLENAFASGKVDCEDLASEMCVGRAQLNRKIKAITGYKTTEYILMARLSKAKHLLRTTDLPVGEISMKCGIEDVGYFSTLFRKHVGMPPSTYRNS
jgi:DNA-binding response OmpR family regulator